MSKKGVSVFLFELENSMQDLRSQMGELKKAIIDSQNQKIPRWEYKELMEYLSNVLIGVADEIGEITKKIREEVIKK